MSTQTESRDGMLDTLALKSNISIEVVKDLYEKEVERLRTSSRVKTFIDVIASRRVRSHLLEMSSH